MFGNVKTVVTILFPTIKYNGINDHKIHWQSKTLKVIEMSVWSEHYKIDYMYRYGREQKFNTL